MNFIFERIKRYIYGKPKLKIFIAQPLRLSAMNAKAVRTAKQAISGPPGVDAVYDGNYFFKIFGRKWS